jgi:hypothetical protein
MRATLELAVAQELSSLQRRRHTFGVVEASDV